MKSSLFISIICLIAATCSAANGLKCWLCLGSLDSDCFRGDEKSMVPYECAAAFRNATTPKLPVRIKDEDDNKEDEQKDETIVSTCVSFVTTQYGSTYIERGCGYFYEGLDICEYMSEISDILFCSACNEDRCNIVQPASTIVITLV